jgi:hypothetical protein
MESLRIVRHGVTGRSRRPHGSIKAHSPCATITGRIGELCAAALRVRKGKGGPVRREFNVLALVKGNERYVFVYDDDSRAELLNAFRDQAADPRLSFSWFDAAVLTDKAREQAHNAASATPVNIRF